MSRLILIIPIEERERARELLSVVSGEDCSRLFDPTLNAAGDADDPATHCVCNWDMPDDLYAEVQAEFSKDKWRAFKAQGSRRLDKHPQQGRRSAHTFMVEKGLSPRRRKGQL